MNVQSIKKLVINLPNRTDRLEQIRKELPKLFFNPEFEIISGVKGNIVEAHKTAIEYARYCGWKEVLVMEDDLRLSDSPELISYVEEVFKHVPEKALVLSGGVYGGYIDYTFNHWEPITHFAGAHFLVYKQEAYDKILNYDFGNVHYDRGLSSIVPCYIVNKMFAFQHNGYSDHRGKHVNDEHYLNGAKLLV